MRKLLPAAASADLRPSNETAVDRRLTFDKVTNVHYSGTAHDEDQPSHLLVHTEVCSSICGPEYGHPCTRFCPANVYEIAREADGTPRLQINASNCVHCKTCDIMDPYQVITWVPPKVAADLSTTECRHEDHEWKSKTGEGNIGPRGRGLAIIRVQAPASRRHRWPRISADQCARAHLRWRVEGMHHYEPSSRRAANR
jgi:ferredoxin-like protein FixX